jgi:hypothetical protein
LMNLRATMRNPEPQLTHYTPGECRGFFHFRSLSHMAAKKQSPPPADPPKRGRGQPPKPPGERTQVISLRLPEHLIAWLASSDPAGSYRDAAKRLLLDAKSNSEKS